MLSEILGVAEDLLLCGTFSLEDTAWKPVVRKEGGGPSPCKQHQSQQVSCVRVRKGLLVHVSCHICGTALHVPCRDPKQARATRCLLGSPQRWKSYKGSAWVPVSGAFAPLACTSGGKVSLCSVGSYVLRNRDRSPADVAQRGARGVARCLRVSQAGIFHIMYFLTLPENFSRVLHKAAMSLCGGGTAVSPKEERELSGRSVD